MALWRGWLPSVIGVIPYVGLNFSVYETLKDMTLKHYGEILPPPPCPETLAFHQQHAMDLRFAGSTSNPLHVVALFKMPVRAVSLQMHGEIGSVSLWLC